jgi:hypothetical protein
LDDFLCAPICRISIAIEPLTTTIGPAGDILYLPFWISGGVLSGLDPEASAITGTDFACMYADEKLVHQGQFVVAHPDGDIMFSYAGTSQALQGAYDELLDGKLPQRIPCKLTVQTSSTHREWRLWNRQPLIAVGTFDGVARQLDIVSYRCLNRIARRIIRCKKAKNRRPYVRALHDMNGES